MNAAVASMLEIVEHIEGELARGESTIELDVLDPDIGAHLFAGEVVDMPDGGQFVHRPFRVWVDLAERLRLRLHTPERLGPPFVRLTFEKLVVESSSRDQPTDDAKIEANEKYGTSSAFARVRKLEDPAFVIDLTEALERVVASLSIEPERGASSSDDRVRADANETRAHVGGPIVAPPPEGAEKKWYIVNTLSGHENKAKLTLLERVQTHNLGEYFGDVLVPTASVTENIKGQRRTTTRKFFPGYMFVQMILDDRTFHLVENTPKIIGFLGGMKPAPIPPSQIQGVQTNVAEGKPGKTRARVTFEAGESLRVVDGPFAGFSAKLEDARDDLVGADANQIRAHVGTGAALRVLDLGVNTGDELALILARIPALRDATFVGVDHSPSALATARERFASRANISFVEVDLSTAGAPGDAGALLRQLGRFDLVIAIGLLQSGALDDRALLRCIVQDHLAPRGAVILGMPNCRYIAGEVEYGARIVNITQPELGLLVKDLAFYRKYLQQHHRKVFVTGKHYVLVTAIAE